MIPPFPSAFLFRGPAFVLLTGALLAGSPARAQAPVWQTALAAAGASSSVTATAADAAGNVYVAGQFTGTLTLGSSLTLTSAGAGDAFVAKWTATSRTFTWAQRAGGTGADAATAVAVSGGSVYVAGNFGSGTASFGSVALTNASATGTTDGFVAKYADAGSTVGVSWAQRLGSPADDEATSLAVVGSSVYVAGSFRGTASFGSTILSSTASNTTDIFVAKLTDAGSTAAYTWAQRAGGADFDFATSLAVSGNSVYVAGSFLSAATFGITNLSSAGNGDVYVAKLTDAGPTASFTWAQRAGGINDDYASGLAVRGANVYLAGGFSSFAAAFGTFILSNNGNADIFVAKLADAGATAAFTWAQRAGGNNFDQATAVAVSGTNVYVTGQFNSTTASFGSGNIVTNNLPGVFDTFLTRLTDAGSTATFGWVQQAGGVGPDFGTAVAVNGSQVYLGGSVVPLARFGSINVVSPVGVSVGFLASLTDDIATATAQASPLTALSVYPNPARHQATVQLPTWAAPAATTLILTDASGRIVRTERPTAVREALELPLSSLAPGLYHVQVLAGSQRAVGTLVVE